MTRHLAGFLGLLLFAGTAAAQPCAWEIDPPKGSLLSLLSGPAKAEVVSGLEVLLGTASSAVDTLPAPPPLELSDTLPAPSIPDTACGKRIFRLADAYLDKYGSSQPIFPFFNGGFYNFLKDSLAKGNQLSIPQYEYALHVLYGWVALTQANHIPALELFGDVLYRHPDRYIGNYFGGLVYLRAASLSSGTEAAAFETKALYALEAPNDRYDRFDRYRFTQLKKALQEDIAAGGERAAATDGAGFAAIAQAEILFLAPEDGGRLGPMLRKAWVQAQEKLTAKQRFGDEVSRKAVKKDTSFNLYAILLIATVIIAIVFFWVQVRRSTRK